jgi:hypothetical protein
MTRQQARRVFYALDLTGELYRGHTLISPTRGEWRIAQMPYRTFNTRQEARRKIDEHINEFAAYEYT